MTVIRPNSIAGITSLTALGTAIDFYNVNGAGIAFNNVNLNNTSGVSTFSSVRATSIVGVSTIGVTTAYVTSINDGSIGLKNRIINPSMEVDQRFAGVTTNFTTSNSYCVDRWAISAGAAVSGTLTAQRVATSAPGGPRYALRMARTSGTFSSYLVTLQAIETANCYDLAGRQVTVSFKARGGSSYNGATVNSFVRTGTAADEGNAGATAGTWTGYAQAGTFSANVTTSFQTFSYTATLGSSVQEIALGIYTGNFTGTGSANDYLDITDVQLEVGPVASTFERRDFGQELFLCQRYYEKSFNLATVPAQAVGSGAGAFQTVQVVGQSAAQYCGSVSFKVRKRATPSVVTLYNPISANAQFYNANSGGSTSSTAASDISEAGFHLNTITQAGSGAAGNGLFIHWSASAEL